MVRCSGRYPRTDLHLAGTLLLLLIPGLSAAAQTPGSSAPRERRRAGSDSGLYQGRSLPACFGRRGARSALFQQIEPEGQIFDLALTADANRLIVSTERGIYLYRVSDGLLLRTYITYSAEGYRAPHAVAAHGDVFTWPQQDLTGKRLLLSRIDDGTTVRGLEDLPEHFSGSFGEMRFSPDGHLLAVQVFLPGSSELWIYRLSDGTRQQVLYTPQLTSFTFNADGEELIGAWEYTVQFWRVRDGAPVRSFSNDFSFRHFLGYVVWNITASPDGETFAASTGGGVLLWRLNRWYEVPRSYAEEVFR